MFWFYKLLSIFGVTKLKTVAVQESYNKRVKMSPDIVRRANDRMIAKGREGHKTVSRSSEGIVVKVSYRNYNKTVVLTKEKINEAYKKALQNVRRL